MTHERKIIRLRKVIEMTGLGRSTIYKAVKDGLFPSQISLGPRAVGWLEPDIQQWLDSRIMLSRGIKHVP